MWGSDHSRWLRRALALGVATVFAALGAQAVAGSNVAGRAFTLRGNVDRVIDGDTVVVALESGKTTRVRLIGIDTPERGRCYAGAATTAARKLADGADVVLKGDSTQATHDRYGRLLAYVWIPGGKDLGFQMVARGLGKVYVYDRPFQRLGAYRTAETRAKRLAHTLWTDCGTRPPPPPPPTKNCDPSYPDVCIPPYDQVGDLDCADVPYKNFRVVGADPHGFDGDRDGIGCEG